MTMLTDSDLNALASDDVIIASVGRISAAFARHSRFCTPEGCVRGCNGGRVVALMLSYAGTADATTGGSGYQGKHVAYIFNGPDEHEVVFGG